VGCDLLAGYLGGTRLEEKPRSVGEEKKKKRGQRMNRSLKRGEGKEKKLGGPSINY